jgi:hypothetical protein
MRGRFSIIVFVGAMLVLLVALNAASYVRVEREAELEIEPDRSTLNWNASGTRALYEFLEETGQRVMRWRETPAALVRASNTVRPQTFVVVGALRVEFKEEEVKSLMEWVEGGGRLVVIDRTPHASLVESAEWRITPHNVPPPELDVRADDTESLTRNAPPLTPTQPTLLTRDVERISPSRFASRLLAARREHVEGASEKGGGGVGPAKPRASNAPVVDEQPTASQNENVAGEATPDDVAAMSEGSVKAAEASPFGCAERNDSALRRPARPCGDGGRVGRK